MIFKVYADVPFDMNREAPVFASRQAREDYMSSLPVRYSEELNFIRYGEPFVIHVPYEKACGYRYGSLSVPGTGDSLDGVFLEVTNVEAVTDDSCRVFYEIDPWMTFMYMKNSTDREWKLADTTVMRRPKRQGDYDVQPYSPDTVSIERQGYFILDSTLNPSVDVPPVGQTYVAFVLKQVKKGDTYVTGPFYCITVFNEGVADNFSAWKNSFIPSDMAGAWVLPHPPAIDPRKWQTMTAPSGDTGHPYIVYFVDDGEKFYENTLCNDRFDRLLMTESLQDPDPEHAHPIPPAQPVRTDEMHSFVVVDDVGSVIFVVPGGTVVTGVQREYRITLASMVVAYRIQGYDRDGLPIPEDFKEANVKGYVFSYVCKSLPSIIDAWQEYNVRQRSVDIELRHQQNVSNLASGLTGGATSSMLGAMTDSKTIRSSQIPTPNGKTPYKTGFKTVRGGVNPVGMGVGLAVEAVGALVNYGVQEALAPRIQAVTDKQFKLAQDEIGAMGDFHRTFRPYDQVMWVLLKGDSRAIKRMNDDIAVNGIHVNETVPDGDFLLLTEGPLQCSSNIKGEIPMWAKGVIRSRLQNGVMIHRIGE